MAQLSYTKEELMQDHDFAREHKIGEHRLHGGFLADGKYQPPRAKVREPAIAAWTESLRARGGDLFDADSSLLTGPRMPNPAQTRLLLKSGLGRPFWNSLTITGKIEGRGRMIADIPLPSLQGIIVEDISEMSIGHLHLGLLTAHGLDEGGIPEEGIGGHDVMWFVARDLAFGADAFPDVEPPDGIARPDAGERNMPELPQPLEGLLVFLMNLLLIEFRAEIGFANTQEVLRMEDLFIERRPGAEEAADIIERIRTDEEIHVLSLRLYLGELRQITFKTLDGGTVAGAELIDRFWDKLVHWATVEQPAIAARNSYDALLPQIAELPDGERVLREFNNLADWRPDDTVAAG